MKLKKLLAATTAAIALSVFAEQEGVTMPQPEAESWIPKISMSHEVSRGYFQNGILWDTNTGYSFALNLDDLFIKNLRLSFLGRLPISQTDYVFQDYSYHSKHATLLANAWDANGVPTSWIQYDSIGLSRYLTKKPGKDLRDDEYDFFAGEIQYNYVMHNSKLGDISLILKDRLQKNADIYSKFSYETAAYGDSFYTGYYDEATGEDIFEPCLPGKYCFKDRVTRRDRIENQVSLGISLDDVLLNPNTSFTINQDGKYFVQMGLKYSIPCNYISDKLFWHNSLDIYYYGMDFMFMKDKYWVNTPYGKGTVITNEYRSKPGFKNLIWKTSFDYSFNEQVNISAYLMAVQRLQDLVHMHRAHNVDADDWAYPKTHDLDFVYGVSLNYAF